MSRFTRGILYGMCAAAVVAEAFIFVGQALAL